MELLIGYITTPHGLKGEVIVHLVSNRSERMTAGCKFTAKSGLNSAPRTLVIDKVKVHGAKYRVQFEGVNSREAAESLHRTELFAQPLVVPGELWVHDLIGSQVETTDGSIVGTVESMESNPASDLLVLDNGILIPLVFVVENSPGRVIVNVPEGLLEIND